MVIRILVYKKLGLTQSLQMLLQVYAVKRDSLSAISKPVFNPDSIRDKHLIKANSNLPQV